MSCTAGNNSAANAFSAAGKSFIFSFAAGTLLSGGNVPVGVVTGTLGAVASLISSVSMPIFKEIFNRTHEHWYENLARILIITCAVSVIATNVPFHISILGSTALSFLVNEFNIFKDRSLDKANVFIVI